jgi:hypothetical protein
MIEPRRPSDHSARADPFFCIDGTRQAYGMPAAALNRQGLSGQATGHVSGNDADILPRTFAIE